MHFPPCSKFLLSILALAACAPAAQAQQPSEGAYVSGGVLWRRTDLTTADTSRGNYIFTDHDMSASGRLVIGYDFSDAWAAEAGYAGLGSPERTASDFAGNAGRLATRGHAWFGAAKRSFTLKDRFALFGKVGVSRVDWEVTGTGWAAPLARDESSTSLYLGGGAQYRFTPTLAGTVELERFGPSKNPGGPLATVSVNVKYKF